MAENPEASGWLDGNFLGLGVFDAHRFFGPTKFVYRQRDVSSPTWQPLRQMVLCSLVEAKKLLLNARMHKALTDLAL